MDRDVTMCLALKCEIYVFIVKFWPKTLNFLIIFVLLSAALFFYNADSHGCIYCSALPPLYTNERSEWVFSDPPIAFYFCAVTH